MKVLETHEQAISNHCVICGNGLDRTSQHIVIDTGYDFDSPGHPLDGRKYVGQCCAMEIAKVCGFLTVDQLASFQSYLRTYREEVDHKIESAKQAIYAARDLVEALPAPPNIDHLGVPAHVLAAGNRVKSDEREKADFVSVLEGESF